MSFYYPCSCDNASVCKLYLCASWDKDGNMLIPASSVDWNPPPHYEHQAPCCYQVDISGIEDLEVSGICTTCENMNGTFIVSGYYRSNDNIGLVAGLTVWDSGIVDEVVASSIIGYLGFSLNSYDQCDNTNVYYSGYTVLDDYNTEYRDFDCRNVVFDVENWIPFGDEICEMSGITATVSGLMTKEQCCRQAFSNLWNLTPCINNPPSGVTPPSGNCFVYDANDREITYYDICGNQVTEDYDDFISRYINITIDNIQISGVTGLDDGLTPSGYTTLTCTECSGLNDTWTCDESIARCCDCDFQMCLSDYTITFAHPSSIFTFESDHGTLATFKSSTPSGTCHSSPLSFEFVSQLSSGYNRCDWSDAGVTINFHYDSLDTRGPCDNVFQLDEDEAVYCDWCLEESGIPTDYLVTIPDEWSYNDYWEDDCSTSGVCRLTTPPNGDFIVTQVPQDLTGCAIDACLSGLWHCTKDKAGGGEPFCNWAYYFEDCQLPSGHCLDRRSHPVCGSESTRLSVLSDAKNEFGSNPCCWDQSLELLIDLYPSDAEESGYITVRLSSCYYMGDQFADTHRVTSFQWETYVPLIRRSGVCDFTPYNRIQCKGTWDLELRPITDLDNLDASGFLCRYPWYPPDSITVESL